MRDTNTVLRERLALWEPNMTESSLEITRLLMALEKAKQQWKQDTIRQELLDILKDK